MRFIIFIPVGLVLMIVAALAVFVAPTAFVALAVGIPVAMVLLVLGLVKEIRDRAGFHRAIRQMQDGTYVPEWQRRV